MDKTLLKAYEALQENKNFAFATVIEATKVGTPQKAGAKMAVFADGTTQGTIGGGRDEKLAIRACLRALKTQKPAILTFEHFGKKGQPICGGQMKVFIEPFISRKHLILCGAGHIALPLSFMAKVLNFNVTIIDNRQALANKKRFPHADKILVGQHSQKLKSISTDPNNSYIVIATHGHLYDFACLKTSVKRPFKYLAVIASKAKRDHFLKDLKKMGVPAKDLKRLSIPAGIDIGAQTPEEIALSIMAEIVSVYNRDRLNSLKFQAKRG